MKVSGSATSHLKIAAVTLLIIVSPYISFADTNDAAIAALKAQLAALMLQLNTMAKPAADTTGATTPTTQPPVVGKCAFSRTLTVGSTGDDVKCLQNYLTAAGHLNSPSGSTGYFGAMTKNAVIAWQSANGISPASGLFGLLSRTKYNNVSGSAPTPSSAGATAGSGISSAQDPLAINSIFPNQFLSNTVSPFTIKGAGFQSGAKVYLGTGQELPITVVVDSNTINSKTLGNLPPANYNIVVRNPDGKSATLQTALSFINAPQNVTAGLSSQEVFNKVAPATVLILAFSGSQSCTGALISTDGNILTNAHCVRNLAGSYTRTVDVYLNDGGYLRPPYKFFNGSVVGVDAINDLAIVKISGTNLPVIPLGNSDDSSLPFTSPVYAFGYPLIFQVSNYTDSLTILPGTVTGRGSSIIQISANIQHGNSGGPLVNKNAELVGINQICTVQTDVSTYCPQGFGGAIPINNIKPLISQLESGYANYGTTQTPAYTTPSTPTTPPPPSAPASLNASVSATPVTQTITAGSQNFTFANIRLDASQSGEDVRVANLPTSIQAISGSLTDLTSCRVMDGSTSLTTGSNVINSTATLTNFVFDNSLTIAKGTVKTLSVQCNVSSTAINGESFQVGLGTPSSFNASGVTSGKSVAVTGTVGGGQIMTVGSASLTVSTDSSSPSLTIAAGGSTGVTLGTYKFRASNDGVSLQKIGLVLTSGNPQDLSNVRIYQGSTMIGAALFVTGHSISTLSSPSTLPKDMDTVITVKGDIAAIGASQPGTSGDTIKVDIDTSGISTQGNGIGSGTTVNATGGSAVSGVRIYRSFPTVAQDTLSSTGVTDGKLIRFKVTANAAGSIGIDQVSWIVNYSGGSITLANVKLYAFSDSAYSTPVSGQAADGQIGPTQATVTSGVSSATAVSSSPVQVAAGSTVYFELRADVTGSTGLSVVTKILGDATFISMSQASSIGSSNNFVWSPNTQGQSATGDSDFTNGANIVGLPSSGFTQARGL